MSDTITIVGTIGTDPERKTPNGLPITTFRVASPQRRFDRATGAWIDTGTNWYTVSAYRGLAEHAFESLHKKDRVILTGRLRVRNWDTGETRGTAVEVDVDAIGHDLLFGTSVFTRDSPAAATSSHSGGDEWAPAEAAAVADETTWASGGTDGADADGPSPEGAEKGPAKPSARPLELAGVETPF